MECINGTKFQSTLGIRSTIGNSPMNRSAFKHGYWAAPRGLQSQEATTISILCPTIDHISFIRDRLVMCNILDVQKGNASLGIIRTYFQSTLGICSAIGKPPMNRIYNRNVFQHGYWAASRGLQCQGATTISILFPTKTMM